MKRARLKFSKKTDSKMFMPWDQGILSSSLFVFNELARTPVAQISILNQIQNPYWLIFNSAFKFYLTRVMEEWKHRSSQATFKLCLINCHKTREKNLHSLTREPNGRGGICGTWIFVVAQKIGTMMQLCISKFTGL
jgi:hypothetical protein